MRGPREHIIRPVLFVLVAATLLCAPATASAQQAPDDEPTASTTQWYGHFTLLADVAGLTLFIGPIASEGEPAVSVIGLVSYTIATPIIHAVHDNDWWGPSFGLRLASIGLIVVGGIVLFSSCPLFSSSCDSGGKALGTTLAVSGMVLGLAMPIVDAVMAVHKPARRRAAIVPLLSLDTRAAGLAVVGRL